MELEGKACVGKGSVVEKKKTELVSDKFVLLSVNFVTLAFSFPTGIGRCILKSCGED